MLLVTLRTADVNGDHLAQWTDPPLVWVACFVVFSLGAIVGLLVAQRQKERAKRLVFAQDRRFKALVESSRDVITVVNRDGGMTVMSPTPGALRKVMKAKSPTHVGQLFSDPAAQMRWLEADRLLVTDADHQQLTFSLVAQDGTSVHFDAVGACLGGSPTEHVWVWRDVTERHALQLQLRQLAFYDTLTGVANRALFRERAEQALELAARRGHQTSVLFCDLDDFKQVNDVYGHAAGDALLVTIAERLRRCTRQRDLVARLGGDEFAMLLEDTGAEIAQGSADRIQAVVAEGVELPTGIVRPRVSIGIATAQPGTKYDELMTQSDQAMYSAKHAGKGRVGVYRVTSNLVDLDVDFTTDFASSFADIGGFEPIDHPLGHPLGQSGIHTDRAGDHRQAQHNRSVPRLGDAHEHPAADEVTDQRAGK